MVAGVNAAMPGMGFLFDVSSGGRATFSQILSARPHGQAQRTRSIFIDHSKGRTSYVSKSLITRTGRAESTHWCERHSSHDL